VLQEAQEAVVLSPRAGTRIHVCFSFFDFSFGTVYPHDPEEFLNQANNPNSFRQVRNHFAAAGKFPDLSSKNI
jgi:hypothetical protein